MMKIFISIGLLVLLGLTSCKDFLEENSQNQVKPSMVSDLEQILLGDGYLDDYNIYDMTDIFTDAYTCNGILDATLQEEFDAKKWRYIWSDKMFKKDGGGDDPRFWAVPYQGIGTCNVVLDNLDDMEGDDRLRGSLRGEALVLRAWYYLQLVNLYGLPYNEGDPATNLGIPLKLDSGVTDEKFTRNTVAEVYAQMEKDLLEGNRLLKEYDFDRNYYRIGHLAAKAILSRMYLYMEDWNKAAAYADSVLQVKPDLLDLNDLEAPDLDYYSVFNSVYDVATPNEIIWMRQYAKDAGDKINYQSFTVKPCPFVLDKKFNNLFGTSYAAWLDGVIQDLRGIFFIDWGWDLDADYFEFLHPYCAVKDIGYGRCQGIRSAELYLNRAEAYAREFIKEGKAEYRVKALDDLNHLRHCRFSHDFEYEEVDIANGNELLDFILEERKRELTGETNHCWFDLRRNGMPEITHVFFTFPSEAKQEYKIPKNRYVLPIPDEALRVNPRLVQNK